MSGIKNLLIGIFVIIAAAVVVFILLFLHPTVGDNGHILHVRFTDLDKVNVGTRVTYAGLPVGEVVTIKEIPDARTDRIAHNGDIYVYELTLRVDSSVNVYNTDTIVLRTSGLLGEKNIEINPQPLEKGEKLVLINDEIIYADSSANVEETLKKFGVLSSKLENVLDSIGAAVDEFREHKILDHVSVLTKNLAEVSETINQKDKIKNIIDNVENLSQRVHQTWNTIDHAFHTLDHAIHDLDRLTHRAHTSWYTVEDSLFNFKKFSSDLNQTWGSIDKNLYATADNTRHITDTLRRIIDDTGEGKGTVGSLFVKDDIYLRLKSILNKGETVAGDVNHYGLLFHQNKYWQRRNAWRNNLLLRLSTPEKFSLYFRDQVDKISTSLSRVSMVLNETECYPDALPNRPEFAQEFADLLRNVEGIDESLKMYNEQIVSRDQKE